jgi:hypothetical protein
MKEIWKYLFSPFVRPKLKFYIGKTTIGTPYFTPRRTIKDTTTPTGLKFVPKKIGFDFVGLGWKTKWSDTDFRFEWSPVASFVFFKWQIAVMVIPENQNHYWEAWLYYFKKTDKRLSTGERVKQCITDFPQTYKVTSHGETKVVDYYQSILKKKWRVISVEDKRNKLLKKLGI